METKPKTRKGKMQKSMTDIQSKEKKIESFQKKKQHMKNYNGNEIS